MTSSKFSKPELRYVEKIDLRVKTLFIEVSVRIVLWHCSIRFRIWKSKKHVETISPVTPWLHHCRQARRLSTVRSHVILTRRNLSCLTRSSLTTLPWRSASNQWRRCCDRSGWRRCFQFIYETTVTSDRWNGRSDGCHSMLVNGWPFSGYVFGQSFGSDAEHWTNHCRTRRHLHSIGHDDSRSGRTCAQVSMIRDDRCDPLHLQLRIDANVDDATHHIEGAHTELLKYLRSVTSNRWLIIKVFAVLIIFFLIFIVFLAWKRCPSRTANNAHINISLSLSPSISWLRLIVVLYDEARTWRNTKAKDFLIIFVFLLLLLHLFINNVRIPTRDSIKSSKTKETSLKTIDALATSSRFYFRLKDEKSAQWHTDWHPSCFETTEWRWPYCLKENTTERE